MVSVGFKHIDDLLSRSRVSPPDSFVAGTMWGPSTQRSFVQAGCDYCCCTFSLLLDASSSATTWVPQIRTNFTKEADDWGYYYNNVPSTFSNTDTGCKEPGDCYWTSVRLIGCN